MSRIRILLADDHETVREGLKTILGGQADFEVVAEVRDGQAAVADAKALLPDVVIMDISMPVMNGLNATEAITEACPDVKVLVLTRHGDEGYLQQLFRAGASGYVLKQSKATELVNAVRTVASGRKFLDPTVTHTVIAGFSRGPRTTATSSEQTTLTPREEETLRLVAWGYSNKEIAAQLGLSVKTVETHKANGSQKLGLRHRIDIVRFALLRGWLDVA